jgi:hypothetical protein
MLYTKTAHERQMEKIMAALSDVGNIDKKLSRFFIG